MSKRNPSPLAISVLLAIALTACSPGRSTPTAVPQVDYTKVAAVAPTAAPTSTIVPTSAPMDTATPKPTAVPTDTAIPTEEPTATPMPQPVECASSFERHALSSYQQEAGPARYTLSGEELQQVLSTMGIASLCIPVDLGAPFVNIDWNSADTPNTTGRMLSLGFEELYPGQGWGDGFLLYSTYDFQTGSEYETFASAEDRDAVRAGTMPGMIDLYGTPGFVRIRPANVGLGTRTIFKAYVFPFDTYYVALVYSLGDYPGDSDWAALVQKLSVGDIPADRQDGLALIDWMAASIQFQTAESKGVSNAFAGALSALQAARQAMAQDFGLDLSGAGRFAIEWRSIEPMDWSDACLGIQARDQMCAQVITPGYKIVLQLHDQTSGQAQVCEYRTNADGSLVLKAEDACQTVADTHTVSPTSLLEPIPVTGWTSLEVADIHLRTEIPAGWTRLGQEYAWSPQTVDALRIGINWSARQPGLEPTAMLPNHAVTLGAEPVELDWGNATAYTVEVSAPAAQGGGTVAIEKHILVLTAQTIYDFYASAPTKDDLLRLGMVLDHLLRSAQFSS